MPAKSPYPTTAGSKLWTAARDGDLFVARELIASQADPNAHASPSTGSTALHEALLAGNREVVDVLLAAGALASKTDSYGNTPLHACAASSAGDDPEVTARVLASPGCDARAVNSDGATALHLAALRGKPSMAGMLVEAGTPLHAVDRAGRDALSFAADAATERLLLELLGRDVLDADKKGKEERPWPSATPWYLGDKKRAAQKGAQPLRPPPRTVVPPQPPAPPRVGKAKRAGSGRSYDRDGRPKGESDKEDALSFAASVQERLVKAFLTADKDGSGAVSKRELYKVLKATGVKDLASEAGLRLFHEADVDGDGKLSFEEFARVARKVRPLLTHPEAQKGSSLAGVDGGGGGDAALSKQVRQKLRRAFVAFDADGSGNISLAELAAAFRQCGIFVPDARLRKMFAEADVDHSGAIDLSEFEALAKRLLAPRKASKAEQSRPRPGAGSATAKVFAALERGGSGMLAAAELPHALKLLGIDTEEEAVARLVGAAAEASDGAMDEASFTGLVHAILTGQEAERDERARGVLKSKSRAAPERAAEAEAKHVHSRLAQAFALADSLDGGTVAAHEVGALLWRAGVVTESSLLAALRPPPSQAAKRIGFDAVLRLAAQAADGTLLTAEMLLAQPPPAGLAAPPASAAEVLLAKRYTHRPLLLTVQRAVLSSWLVDLHAVQSLFVVVRGELAPDAKHGRAPLMLRSATQRKRGATLELGLSAMLVGEASLVEVRRKHSERISAASFHRASAAASPPPLPPHLRAFTTASAPRAVTHARERISDPLHQVELMHEPLASGAAHLLGSAQLELGRLYQSTAAHPFHYELPLYDARAMLVASLQLVAEPHAALTPAGGAAALGGALAASAAAPAGGAAGGAAHAATAAQVKSLESELAQARQRAEALARENAGLRAAKAAPPLSAGGARVAQQRRRLETSDWRNTQLDSLARSARRLKQPMPALEHATAEMAVMVEAAKRDRLESSAAILGARPPVVPIYDESHNPLPIHRDEAYRLRPEAHATEPEFPGPTWDR